MNCIRGSGPNISRPPWRVALKLCAHKSTLEGGLDLSNTRNVDDIDARWNSSYCILRRHLYLAGLVLFLMFMPVVSSVEHDVERFLSFERIPSEVSPFVPTSDDESSMCLATAASEFGQLSSDACVDTNGSYEQQVPHRRETWQKEHASSTLRSVPGQLRPTDLPPPAIFNQFSRAPNVTLPGKPEPQMVQVGTIEQINAIKDAPSKNSSNRASSTEIAYLPQIVDSGSVETILQLLRSYPDLDEDPDTVDGMTTHEIFVDNPEIRRRQEQGSNDVEPSIKVRDSDPFTLTERTRLRAQLQAILQPILQKRITPFVQMHYPDVCTQSAQNSNRACTPCYSLIRRYRSGERQSHGTHYDGHAVITVVISLSNYGTDYTGGLYVSTGYGQRQFVPLFQGDAVSHRSTLLHGVQVFDATATPSNRNRTFAAERWSWILWYRDSVDCEDYSHEWFAECAKAGDAVCQELFATKMGRIPALQNDPARVMAQVVYWNRQSAEQGNGNAAVKMARAYLNLLPSPLQYNVTEAKRYYRIAIASQHPDGFYGMAHLYLSSLSSDHSNHERKQKVLSRVVRFLEEAAIRGHSYAMFNLGIVHCYGYGISRIDTERAAAWFAQSGLPEGYFAAAFQAAVTGNRTRQQQYNEQARALGYYQPWRREARQHTGSGGAGGVDLNLPWPVAEDGRKPPVF